MLKFHVETLDEVEEGLRPQYVEVPEGGGFQLAVDGVDDAAEIKRARDHEKKARQDAEKELKTLKDARKADEEKARLAAEKAAAAAGDVEALRKSSEERLAQVIAEKEGEYRPLIASLESDLDRLLRVNVAQAIASEIALQGSDSLLLPHILARLGVEVRDGKRTTVVVDAAGRPSTMTQDDLKKEFIGNKAFAPVIAGTKASGGGAAGAKAGGGAPAGNQKRAAMTVAEASAYISEHGRDAYLALPEK